MVCHGLLGLLFMSQHLSASCHHAIWLQLQLRPRYIACPDPDHSAPRSVTCACGSLQVLQPAIELADNGFPVAPMAAAQWARGLPLIKQAGP